MDFKDFIPDIFPEESYKYLDVLSFTLPNLKKWEMTREVSKTEEILEEKKSVKTKENKKRKIFLPLPKLRLPRAEKHIKVSVIDLEGSPGIEAEKEKDESGEIEKEAPRKSSRRKEILFLPKIKKKAFLPKKKKKVFLPKKEKATLLREKEENNQEK